MKGKRFFVASDWLLRNALDLSASEELFRDNDPVATREVLRAVMHLPASATISRVERLEPIESVDEYHPEPLRTSRVYVESPDFPDDGQDEITECSPMFTTLRTIKLESWGLE